MNAMSETRQPDGEPIGLASLLAEIAAGAGRDLAHSETLPPSAYTSEDFYKLEVERIFKPGWICVGHVSQVAKEGDYFTIDLMGEMLVVVRAADGVRAMSRICLHRWAPLVEGCGHTKVFSCPFHKWGFDLAGNLLGAPLMEQVVFNAKDCRLPQYRTEISDGFVYVNFSGDAAPLADVLAEFTPEVAHLGMAGMVIAGQHEYTCKFNWKIMVETFMECYHHIAAHPQTFEAAFPARLSYIEDDRGGWTMGVSPARDTTPDNLINIGLPELSDSFTTLQRRAFFLYLVYPFHMLATWPDRVYWFRVQPEAADRTRLQTIILVRPEAKDMPGYDALMTADLAFLDQVNGEDIGVNEMQQRGAATITAKAGRLSHLEKAVWQLADYVRAKVGG